MLTLYRRGRRIRGLPLYRASLRAGNAAAKRTRVHLYPDACPTASEVGFAAAVLSYPFTVLVRFLHDTEYRLTAPRAKVRGFQLRCSLHLEVASS